ncbi:glycoside hydrolase family 30 beta sandwich domain-containing protein [Mucilaginibacter sp.]|uniref:glycoside hydrolase family 30 protein n=1 Tax=Mucilaginibacter sp. TaxID=1882438 RepID=UPI00262CE9C7|nr:glycoside hydrolase family 30 beta sandwich domain-containing protein [Mucilaginibacter sp.]MDB4923924.1 Glucuronoxylanase XynC precursor [Mucilaginibacter sp.]
MKKNIRQFAFVLLAAVAFFAVFDCSKKAANPLPQSDPVTPVTPPVIVKTDVAMWLTKADQSALLAKQNIALNFSAATNSNTSINVDTVTTYQTIDGFGYCLTGGSASVINSLPPDKKSALLKELFLTDSAHIGISYLRISIGASDMSATDFTYDDLVTGTDESLSQFNIDKEKTDLIPVLKSILALNPAIRILACPWTAPVWMKINTIGNNGFTGGSLNPAYYDAYAKYFVKYIQAMKAEGITIDAVTPQNEPLNPNNNPAMVMQANEEANFIKNNLGPQFKAASLATKIIVYDHNTDRTDYPLAVLADAAASAYVDGSAFHLYAGNINGLTTVHTAYPGKNIYFTEQYTPSTGAFAGDLSWHVTNLIIGATRNWSRNVLEWNMATDASYGPHTNGGCSTCQGAITISGSSISRNVSYYIIAHASKFVRPGAVRIASSNLTTLPNVAFKNTDGSKVLIVQNTTSNNLTFNISFNQKIVTSTLPGGAASTYVW